jgi:Fic family protein
MSAKIDKLETPNRIEPALVDAPPTAIADLVADLVAVTSTLGRFLHPQTAANLADLVRVMNTYYSNLIEGHNTRPRDIERAIQGELDSDEKRRNLQLEAAAHVRVQKEIDNQFLIGTLPAATSTKFIRWIHEEFYRDAPTAMLTVSGGGRKIVMKPGEWRAKPEHDNAVGRHLPPSSAHVSAFMKYFEERYNSRSLGTAAKIMAMPTAHHRFNYIHPFPDGNGRVSRLMSHAMAQEAKIGAHGLWSISRGLARGLNSRNEYKQMMDMADSKRQGDFDGRGNLSLRALIEFTIWFLKVCLDQASFMSSLFELETLRTRLRRYVEKNDSLKIESAALLEEALIRGEFERGEINRITGLPSRTARRVLTDLINLKLLSSSTEKGPVSLRFPESVLEDLFPKLYPQV